MPHNKIFINLYLVIQSTTIEFSFRSDEKKNNNNNILFNAFVNYKCKQWNHIKMKYQKLVSNKIKVKKILIVFNEIY